MDLYAAFAVEHLTTLGTGTRRLLSVSNFDYYLMVVTSRCSTECATVESR
jgi:hypothetical protein